MNMNVYEFKTGGQTIKTRWNIGLIREYKKQTGKNLLEEFTEVAATGNESAMIDKILILLPLTMMRADDTLTLDEAWEITDEIEDLIATVLWLAERLRDFFGMSGEKKKLKKKIPGKKKPKNS